MQPASNAASKIAGLKRGSTAFRIASALSARASAAIAAGIGRVDGRGGEARVARAVGGGLRARRVDVGEDHPLEEVATRRDRGHRGADTARSDHENTHVARTYLR